MCLRRKFHLRLQDNSPDRFQHSHQRGSRLNSERLKLLRRNVRFSANIWTQPTVSSRNNSNNRNRSNYSNSNLSNLKYNSRKRNRLGDKPRAA